MARRLKVIAHNFRNAYELAVDSFGDLWQNDNDDQVMTCRMTWLMEGANAGYFSRDGTRFWQADRRPGQDTFTAHWHQDDPGVLPAGDNTGAGAPAGVVRYESDAARESVPGHAAERRCRAQRGLRLSRAAARRRLRPRALRLPLEPGRAQHELHLEPGRSRSAQVVPAERRGRRPRRRHLRRRLVRSDRRRPSDAGRERATAASIASRRRAGSSRRRPST